MIALLATGAGCTDDDSNGQPSSASTAISDQERAFCEAWNEALASGDDSALTEVLADAPPQLERQAATAREGRGDGPQSAEAEAAIAEILDWTELRCPRGGPGASQRRIAPPVDTKFDGLAFCGSVGLPPSLADGESGVMLYGKAGDPYTGPMLGVFWNPADEGGHEGDGAAQPVMVRGQRGVAAPISVFQQTILPSLGTVVAWTEGSRGFGLYGRQWPIERASELVDIANELEESDGRFRIPGDTLPDGYREVFSGDPSVMSVVLDPSALYSLHYQGNGFGSLSLRGLQMTEEEFEAFRFLTLERPVRRLPATSRSQGRSRRPTRCRRVLGAPRLCLIRRLGLSGLVSRLRSPAPWPGSLASSRTRSGRPSSRLKASARSVVPRTCRSGPRLNHRRPQGSTEGVRRGLRDVRRSVSRGFAASGRRIGR